MKSKITDQQTIAELQALCRQKGGLVHPSEVVDAARTDSSPLHKHFEWDDGKAAESYRIEQARGLMQRVFVRVDTPEGVRESQVFVSLTSDREQDGGYRELVRVLSDKGMRNQLVRDALSDMQIFTQRYKTIQQLAEVFTSIKKLVGNWQHN